MYHRIVSPVCPIPGGEGDETRREEARYAVDLGEFEWQLQCLKSMGLAGVSVRMAHEALASGDAVPPDWVVISFDDGNRSDYEHAFPLLSGVGFSATFFVGCARIGVDGGLEEAMLNEICHKGFDVGSHGMTHRFLTNLGPDDEENELRGSKETLERITGQPVDFFAPPGGRIGRRGISALKRLSYKAVCTSEFGYNDRKTCRFSYARIPIGASTSRALFRDYLRGSLVRLYPLYVRSAVLQVARKMMGETLYRRFRTLGLRH